MVTAPAVGFTVVEAAFAAASGVTEVAPELRGSGAAEDISTKVAEYIHIGQGRTFMALIGKPLLAFKKGTTVKGSPTMRIGGPYTYILEANPGTEMDPRFTPYCTPGEMLALGVFEGKYINDCTSEFPREWFLFATALGKLSPGSPNIACNYFKVKSRQPLSVWKENGWVPKSGSSRKIGARAMLSSKENPDERGWFQWYCRYWLGRRIPALDAVQIGRWRSFVRHAGAVKARCSAGDLSCSPKERQALLQWAHNPFL
jgi:hypothetical protein